MSLTQERLSPIMGSITVLEDAVLAKRDKTAEVADGEALDMERIKQRLDMLDNRLDNIDSMVTAVAERVMSQLVNLVITCPHCGKSVEIAVMGTQKPTR